MMWFIIHAAVIFLIAYLLRPSQQVFIYWSAMTFKLALGFLLGYVYFEWVGGGDTVAFHEQARELALLSKSGLAEYFSRLTTSPYHIYMSEARNELFVKIISIIYLLSAGSYWVAAMYFSFISFLGAWYLVRSVKAHYPTMTPLAIIAFLFLPSVVFWSAGVLKDSLINAALFFLAGIAVHYAHRYRFQLWEVIISAMSLLLLFYLKHYLFAMTFMVLGLLTWFYQVIPLFRHFHWKVTGSIVILVLFVFLASLVNPKLHFDQLPETIFYNYETILAHSSGPVITFPGLAPTWDALWKALPVSLFSGLFRPFFWEVTPVYFVFAAESLLVVLLSLINLYYLRSIKMNLLVWLGLLFIIILAAFLPLVSPNFGSLVRYKVAYWPFLVLLLSIRPFQLLLAKSKMV